MTRPLLAVALIAAAAITGCSAAATPPRPSLPGTSVTAGPQRWWNAGDDYCTILRRTLGTGQSVFGALRAGDPATTATTVAFVDDLRRTAPASVAAAWRVLGPALVDLVESAGRRSESGADARATATAASRIATDARSRCDVDLAARS